VRRHAIEVRLNAEDPHRNFQPSPGRITRWVPPHGAGVRLDSHCYEGYLVPPFYDSMVGKLIVTAATRAECVVRLRAALENFTVEGLTTNLPLLRYIAAHPDFIENRLNTRWLEQTLLPAFSATQE
jgi:acetyl-CoA carboxylase biotin carboxylase subunit